MQNLFARFMKDESGATAIEYGLLASLIAVVNGPIVSIVIPAYNRAHLLPRAIDSIIAQTLDDWEIVLVDDGSTDETPDLARDYERRLQGNASAVLPWRATDAQTCQQNHQRHHPEHQRCVGLGFRSPGVRGALLPVG